MQDCALLSFLRSSGEYITVLQHIPVCGMQIVVFCTIYGYAILYMYLIPYISYGERTDLLPKHLIIGIWSLPLCFLFFCFFLSFPFFLCVWGDARSNLSTRMVLRKETHHLSFAFRIHACYCMHTNTILSFCHSLKQDWCPNMPEKKD